MADLHLTNSVLGSLFSCETFVICGLFDDRYPGNFPISCHTEWLETAYICQTCRIIH